MKKLLTSGLIGISIALIIFSVMGIVFDLVNGGVMQMQNYQYTKMVLGSIVIGIGFGLPSFIYDNDRVPSALQIIFHMGIGCAVMLITAFVVGWIPIKAGIHAVVLAILGEIIVSALLWKCFSYHYKKEAASINKKIKSINK